MSAIKQILERTIERWEHMSQKERENTLIVLELPKDEVSRKWESLSEKTQEALFREECDYWDDLARRNWDGYVPEQEEFTEL